MAAIGTMVWRWLHTEEDVQSDAKVQKRWKRDEKSKWLAELSWWTLVDGWWTRVDCQIKGSWNVRKGNSVEWVCIMRVLPSRDVKWSIRT